MTSQKIIMQTEQLTKCFELIYFRNEGRDWARNIDLKPDVPN